MSFVPDIKSIDFIDLYCTSEEASYQEERYLKAIAKFTELYGESEERIEIYSAPGRTEIGGNHTDHQRGQVLAASINKDTIGVVRITNDYMIKLVSDDHKQIRVNLQNLKAKPKENGSTKALIRGVASCLKEWGYEIGGFEAYVTSNVLVGAGLSSSAAFEVLIGTILSGLYNNSSIDSVTIAKAGQIAENIFFGKPCGLMDQMACSVGNLVYIDFFNPKEPEVKKIDFDFNAMNYSLLITNTRGSHSDLTEEYASIPREMRRIAKLLDKKYLRDISYEEIIKNIKFLRKKAGDRAVLRALHFVRETRRAEDEAKSLNSSNFEEFINLINESGNSSFKYLQNIYCSSDYMNQNLSIALSVSDSLLGNKEASRVHGGGFAGTIQAFVKNENVAKYKETMDSIFGEASCEVLSIRKYGGIKVI